MIHYQSPQATSFPIILPYNNVNSFACIKKKITHNEHITDHVQRFITIFFLKNTAWEHEIKISEYKL